MTTLQNIVRGVNHFLQHKLGVGLPSEWLKMSWFEIKKLFVCCCTNRIALRARILDSDAFLCLTGVFMKLSLKWLRTQNIDELARCRRTI